jgi:hypothetical protein
VEAQAAQRLLTHLQSAAERARLGDMRARHAAQLREAEASHAAACADHTARWEEKRSQYEQLVSAQLEKISRAAAAREADLEADLTAKAPRRLQPSRELLELRGKQEALGKQGKYAEAANVQRIADRLEGAETYAAREAFAAECARHRDACAAKSASERASVEARAERGREQMSGARKADAEQLLQRFRNACAALESTQKREAVTLELFLNTQLLAGKREKGGVGGSIAASSPPGTSSPSSPKVGGSAGSPARAGWRSSGDLPPSKGGLKTSPLAKALRATGGGGAGSPARSENLGVGALRSAVARKSAGSFARSGAATSA